MRRLVIVAVLLAVSTHAVEAQTGTPPAPVPSPAQAAVQSGLRYLTKEGTLWMEVRKCASCHHVPFMIWTLHEAKNHGYAIDAKALADVSAWVLAKDDPGKVFVKGKPKKDEKPSKDLSQAPLVLALAFAAIQKPDAAQRAGLTRFQERVREEQDVNGSWHLGEGNRRPPMMADPDVITQWALLALSNAPAADQPVAKSANFAAAQKWLASVKPSASHESPIVQLLVQKRLGKTAKELEPLIKHLLDAQTVDGGWSQTKEMPSDAYATGQTFYALTAAGLSPQAPPLQKAAAFLVKNQRADGSWPMTSRPIKPGDTGCKNTDPITYLGSAWATIALARSAPIVGATKAEAKGK